MGHGLVQSAPLCRLLLRSASVLVPGRGRAEWLAEWKAELWQVLRSKGERRDQGAHEAAGHSSPIVFCLGAFQDAWWLRQNNLQPPSPAHIRHGSPSMCLLSLAGCAAAAFMLALCLPDARKAMLPVPYPDADSLVLISPGGSSMSPLPSIRLADYRSWQTSTRGLFTELAYYQPSIKRVHVQPHQTVELSIIRASASLFDMLKFPSLTSKARQESQPMPGLILSENAWREYFEGDPEIAGRVVEVAGLPVRIAAVLPQDRWRLPGDADAWMMADESHTDSLPPNSKGFVLAAMRPSAFPSGSSGRHWMTVYGDNGRSDRFECVSLAEQTRQPFSMYLFTLFIAFLALPATTPLPLGEYPARAERLGWDVRVRRWLFLAAKLALILPLVYFASIDLAYGNLAAGQHSVGPISSQYLHLSGSFLGLLFAFRWALRDQRSRCPVCLRLLTNPARVGEASRNFLAWNGTELICAGGHGLLHIPEIPTSWFSTQRWLYLDPSWSSLFSDSYIAPAGVL
jgi:MacB-like periplasmic core domain